MCVKYVLIIINCMKYWYCNTVERIVVCVHVISRNAVYSAEISVNLARFFSADVCRKLTILFSYDQISSSGFPFNLFDRTSKWFCRIETVWRKRLERDHYYISLFRIYGFEAGNQITLILHFESYNQTCSSVHTPFFQIILVY